MSTNIAHPPPPCKVVKGQLWVSRNSGNLHHNLDDLVKMFEVCYMMQYPPFFFNNKSGIEYLKTCITLYMLTDLCGL